MLRIIFGAIGMLGVAGAVFTLVWLFVDIVLRVCIGQQTPRAVQPPPEPFNLKEIDDESA